MRDIDFGHDYRAQRAWLANSANPRRSETSVCEHHFAARPLLGGEPVAAQTLLVWVVPFGGVGLSVAARWRHSRETISPSIWTGFPEVASTSFTVADRRVSFGRR
jgi:hypothetical protein